MKGKILKEKELGITLIALIITIIILLILAAISISMISGENGILTQTSKAKINHEIGIEKEKVDLAAQGAAVRNNGQFIKEEDLIDELNKIIGDGKYELTGDGPWTVTYTDTLRSYPVNQLGVVAGENQQPDDNTPPDDGDNTYSIIYNLDGGMLEEGVSNPLGYTEETETFTLNNPTKEGYTFKGWTSTDLTDITKTVTIQKGSTGDRTYTANWIKEIGLLPIIKELPTSWMETSTVSDLKRNDDEEKTNFTINKETYETVIYYFPEDVIVSKTTIPDDNTTTNIDESGILTFGNTSDVATSSTALGKEDGHMVVAIFEKNLTIESTGKITAYNTNYGGPKGMFICVKGTLTNNGEITMTARGANAVGDNVYLFSNDATNWEYIPAEGADPGTTTGYMQSGSASYSKIGVAGNAGSTKSIRATGGGGQGGMRQTNTSSSNPKISGGYGTAGTSYSGGSGGGGVTVNSGQVSTFTGKSGIGNGGAGGNGSLKETIGQSVAAGGGAGNPGGEYSIDESKTTNATVLNRLKGNNGTGGLLIIYGENVINNNVISSNGTNGGGFNADDGITALGSDDTGKRSGGGGSGGGSVNIFYNLSCTVGNIYCSGGQGGTGSKAGTDGATISSGGAGGAGTATIGSIANSEYKGN